MVRNLLSHQLMAAVCALGLNKSNRGVKRLVCLKGLLPAFRASKWRGALKHLFVVNRHTFLRADRVIWLRLGPPRQMEQGRSDS
jgi:hypothetical protein